MRIFTISLVFLAGCATSRHISSSDSAQPLSGPEKELICKAAEQKYPEDMARGARGESRWQFCLRQGAFSKYRGNYSITPPGAGGGFLCKARLNGDEENPEFTEDLVCEFHGN